MNNKGASKVKESEIKIMVTRDHSIFKSQKGNRAVCQKDVDKIEAKILADNLLRFHPILVNDYLEVIDGQHRLEVAKKHGLFISYIVMDNKADLSTTQKINTTTKLWRVKDFLQSYVSLNYKEYVYFQSIMNEFKFLTISQLIDISSIGRSKEGSKTTAFKEGNMSIPNKPKLEDLLDRINTFYEYDKALARKTHFQRFLNLARKRGVNFDVSRMIERMSENRGIVKSLPNNPYTIADVLGEIYNHRLHDKNKINFNLREVK